MKSEGGGQKESQNTNFNILSLNDGVNLKLSDLTEFRSV